MKYVKNKYAITVLVFIIYSLFLDENDIFKIRENKSKLRELEEIERASIDHLEDTYNTLEKLKQIENVEHYARSKKFFKKDNEDIFVISYE
jgi:hypothetical protein